MDQVILDKIYQLVSQLSNEADKSVHDSIDLYNLLHSASNSISLLLIHVGYIESRLNSMIESNKIFSTQIDNLTAENHRLNSIIRY